VTTLNLAFYNFEVRHPRCVSNKSYYKVYVYIVKHNYRLGGMLFTIRKAQLHVSATNVGPHPLTLARSRTYTSPLHPTHPLQMNV